MNTPRHQFAFCHDEESVCVNTSAETLPELVEAFERYLVACGFVLPDGVHLGYEEDDDISLMDASALASALAKAKETKAVVPTRPFDALSDLNPSEDRSNED